MICTLGFGKALVGVTSLVLVLADGIKLLGSRPRLSLDVSLLRPSPLKNSLCTIMIHPGPVRGWWLLLQIWH